MRRIRETRFAWTRNELAQKIGKSESAVQAIETGQSPTVYTRTLRAIAEAFGMSLDQAQSELAPTDRGNTSLPDANFSNVVLGSEQRLAADIPVIELSLSATRWTNVADNESMGQFLSKEQVRQGLFRVRVHGDCMKGTVEDGELIELRLLVDPSSGQPDLSMLRKGRAYYVQSDEGATLKLFDRHEGDELVFRAANRKYKNDFRCRADEVLRLAVAIGTVKLFD